jgi:hypothetical protein
MSLALMRFQKDTQYFLPQYFRLLCSTLEVVVEGMIRYVLEGFRADFFM